MEQNQQQEKDTQQNYQEEGEIIKDHMGMECREFREKYHGGEECNLVMLVHLLRVQLVEEKRIRQKQKNYGIKKKILKKEEKP